MSEKDTIQKSSDGPVTIPRLVEDLKQLGIKPGMTLLVHSSLSALGWVCGGSVAVIQALQDVLGEEGSLVMPTHSAGLTDPSLWENPPVDESWWEAIRETMPAYDPRLTPTCQMGAIPECFRNAEGVVRSSNPVVSFAAWGKHAKEITSDHGLDYNMGYDSPLGRIYDLYGYSLLLGVGYNKCTIMHLAESMATFENKKTYQQSSPIMESGERIWKSFIDWDYNVEDLAAIGRDYENKVGDLQKASVGYAESILMPVKPLVDFGKEWFEVHSK